MAEDASRMIEVIGISEKTTKDTLLNYFSSSKRGGEIGDLQYDKEKGEACITFKCPEGAQQALSATHRLENVTLSVRRRRAELLEPNKLYVEGFHSGTSSDSLKYYIENIGDTDVSDVTFGSRCNAIITTNSELDFKKLLQLSQAKPLEKNTLTIKRVPVCTTILVADLPATANEESILYKFESPRSGGDEVKNVKMNPENRQALVEFKDPKVLKNVLSQKQTLDGVELKVTPHYPYLSGLKNEQKNTVVLRVCEPLEIDRDLYQYLIEKHPQNLKLALKNTQQMVDEKKGSVIVTVETSDAENDLRTFLKDFKWDVVRFDPVLADYGLRSKMKDIVEIFGYSTAVSFQQHYSEGYIKIVGRTVNIRERAFQEVDKCVKEMTDKYKEETTQCEHVVKLSMTNLKLLQRSAEYQTLEIAWRQQSVDVRLDKDRERILVKGPRDQVTQVQAEIQQLVRSFGKRELEQKPSLLLKSPAAMSYVKKLLLDNHLEVELSTNDSKKIILQGVVQADVDEAYQFIISTVRELNIPLSATNSSFRREEFKDEFIKNVGSSTPILLNIKNDELEVVCFENDFNNLRLKAKDFMEEKKHHKVRFPMEKAVAHYFLLHGERVLQGLRLSSPDLSIEQQSEAIMISGPKPLVESCEASIKEIVQDLTKETINFGTPETCASLTGEVAEKVILGIEQKRKCAIIVNVREEIEETDGLDSLSMNAEEYKESMEKTLQCRYTYPNGKIIEVHQGDILNHPADFLVNSANEELKHSGGIAKAIVDKGGYKIQEDCLNMLKEKGKSKLMPSDVVSTDAGKLLCKKILHVVVPKWKNGPSDYTTGNEGTREGRVLRHACLSALNEAKQGKSVAIPALGTGIYKIPHAISARSLITAAGEFLTGNTHSELSEIHFVDKESTAVEAFMKEMVEKYGSDSNFEINERVRDRWVPGPRENNKARKPPIPKDGQAFCTKEGMKIQLTIGNIATSETDVIVNTVHSSLDLTKNPCSKALLEVAGKALENHCEKWVRKNEKVKEGSFAVTDGAKLKCKKVFHLCCPNWNATDGEQNLRKLVKDVLSEAFRLKYSSVAIPALGTGTLKYPEDIVAKVLLEEPMKFSKNHGASNRLKQVDIVVYSGNERAVKKFTETFQSYSSKLNRGTPIRETKRSKKGKETPTFPTPRRISETWEEVSAETNGLKIELVQGDMVQESTDAIAFFVGSNIREGGQLGAALIEGAGESLEREYAGIKKVEPGTVVMTSAGNLKAKYLLHMVPKKKIFMETPSSENVRELLNTCLNEADSFQFKSISLPAVGTGSMGKGGKKSAEIMHESISNYAKRQTKFLQLIRIVILQPTVFQEFRESFLKQESSFPLLYSSDGRGSPTTNSRKSRALTRARRRITLDIVGDSSSDIDKIKEDLNQIEKERCYIKTIENDTIAHLSSKNLKEIFDLQNQYSVLIECKREIGYLRISGLSQNVANATTAVYDKIFRFKEEKYNVAMSSQTVQWFFYDASDGHEDIVTPEKYDDDTNAKIEKAHKEKVGSVIVGDNAKYRIDFDTMMETNLSTAEVMKVFRSSREGFPVPECWVYQPIVIKTGQEVEVHLVNIDAVEHPTEFDEVYEKFNKTMQNSTVVSIQRIQNPRLYQIYKGHQQKMNERGRCNEQKLFHGTTKDTVEKINSQGFNRAFCGKNATRFGKGVYFARDARYSSRQIYAVPDENGVQYMYVARVLVGQYTKGKEGIIVPPPIDEGDPTVCYDTVVDDVSNPGMFVVFYDYQCYPEYLIAFKKQSRG